MQLILSLTAAGACVLLGLCRASRLMSREKALEGWADAMARMESAVTHFSPPISDILREGAACAPALAAVGKLMEAAPARPLDELWRELPCDDAIRDAEWAMLGDCLRGLQETTVARQREAIRRTREKWSPLLLSARKARERGVRAYCSLGWLGGAAVFILMQ